MLATSLTYFKYFLSIRRFNNKIKNKYTETTKQTVYNMGIYMCIVIYYLYNIIYYIGI